MGADSAKVTPPEPLLQTFERDRNARYALATDMTPEELGDGRTRVTISILHTSEERDEMLSPGWSLYGCAVAFSFHYAPISE